MSAKLIELPCCIGDAVWIIRSYQSAKHAKKGFVSEMRIISDKLSMTDELKILITVKGIARGYWGENVFATFEEAEAAKRERKTK